jgi:putative thiamine transport system ATP-binding protein
MTLKINHLTVYENHNDAQEKPLISNLSITVNKGEILTLMGPSGSGKSTLLSVIAGFITPDFSYSGELYLADKPLNDIKPENRKIGILFQDDLLFPHLSIIENLMVALPNAIKGKQRRESALRALQQVNLQQLADSSPLQVSGGQKARVGVLRLLLAEPSAVLLDEPFSKLDSSLRSEFREWVFSILKERSLPTILVTHDSEDSPPCATTLHWPWDQKEVNNA